MQSDKLLWVIELLRILISVLNVTWLTSHGNHLVVSSLNYKLRHLSLFSRPVSAQNPHQTRKWTFYVNRRKYPRSQEQIRLYVWNNNIYYPHLTKSILQLATHLVLTLWNWKVKPLRIFWTYWHDQTLRMLEYRNLQNVNFAEMQ